MKEWFNNLRRQEQILLLVGAAAVALYIVFFWLLGPMSVSIANLQQQNRAAAETLVEVKQLAQEYQQLQGGTTAARPTGNLTRIVDTTVKNHQLAMSRFQPSASGDAQVRFENAPFNHVVAWLNELETENGILIKDISITPGTASGLVNVSVRLNKNG